MSLNKKILAVAVVSALFATAAQAQVVISNATPVPVAYTNNIIATVAAPVTLGAQTVNALRSALGYSFSNGEVRYARFECSSNMTFAANAAATFVQGASVNGLATLGAVNGLPGSAISFSVTANDAFVTSDDLFNISGDRNITSTAGVSCTYGLYDQPSQAQAGGSTGRIATSTGPYLSFVNSYAFTSTAKTATANVEAPTAFGEFVTSGNTLGLTADLAAWNYGLTTSPGLIAAGTGPITLAALMDATAGTGTRIVVTGDFSIAASAGAVYDAAARARVFISTGNNCTSGTAASALTATTATFSVGATPVVAQNLCLTNRTGTTPIPVADYTALLTAVSAAPTVYAVSNIGSLASGSIVRNGTQLQAPLAQVPGGYLSRMVLTNTGSVDRPYTITVTGEPGNNITTANLTGTVPANGTRVVDLNTVLIGFTPGMFTRATLNVTIAGPDKQIQGLYQIVNPAYGSVSNHVMVRPGTN